MKLECLPMPCLIDDVECFWLERVVGNQQVIPQGVFDIFINTHMRYYGTDKQRFQPSMWLVGQHTCQYQLTAQALCWVFSIRLQPFALLPFPQFNALEIKNTLQNIADSFGGHTLANQVLNILCENKRQTAKTVCSELAQIWRLNRFLMLAHSGKLPSMTEAAIAAGFYEQAHLILEFIGILNCTPTVYFNENGFDSATITQINKRFAGVYNPIEQKD
ncbi:helix-turn-helix domain-containing protein [Pseudoalteromonas sp. MMG022]|uniref:helix-turn-helix domain-containing protein n=1 Tax=Pseudoalteromonas sp. MMG022 TaxID=2909978 RepID=UPI001F2429CF|nr:helix-turn-helix domain-containing protein [Pseudoalteromonas sp. MMG022]MCF6436752.1 helix-turn-helix domain-containing protein [Pseudoalteromonas sp. MMG022]